MSVHLLAGCSRRPEQQRRTHDHQLSNAACDGQPVPRSSQSGVAAVSRRRRRGANQPTGRLVLFHGGSGTQAYLHIIHICAIQVTFIYQWNYFKCAVNYWPLFPYSCVAFLSHAAICWISANFFPLIWPTFSVKAKIHYNSFPYLPRRSFPVANP